MNIIQTALQTENPIDGGIVIPADCSTDFIKAMKIAYYKTFRKNGLISDSQFDILMKMQKGNGE